MPTKRRFIIFLIVLALMLLIKRAAGQEAAVGWDPAYTCGGYGGSMPDEAQSLLTNSTIMGFLLGISKVWARTMAERRGTYLAGDLIQLRLQ
jgi:hypothetical protein